jgi:hypothetical protein
VDPPFEEVGEHEHRNDQEPLPGGVLHPAHAPGDDRDAIDFI